MYVTILFPSIPLEKRHEIEDTLEEEGFDVIGAGMCINSGVQDIGVEVPRSKLRRLRSIVKSFGFGFEIE